MPLSFTAALILFAMGYIIEQRQLIPIGEINPPQWEHIKHRQISIDINPPQWEHIKHRQIPIRCGHL
eukprot:Em0130g5a